MAVTGVVVVAILGLGFWAFGDDLHALLEVAPRREVDEDGWPVTPGDETPATVAVLDRDSGPATVVIAGAPANPQPPIETGTIIEGVPPLTLATDEQPTAQPRTGTVASPQVTNVRFGKARGFRDALVRTGTSVSDADAIVAALQRHVDFRRCRPEHTLTFERDAAGELRTFEYRVSRTELYRATRSADGFEGEQVPIKIENQRVAKGGNVSGSLGQALDHAELGRALVGAFVEVFERSISFNKDTRKGDSFRIIVDKQYVEGDFFGYGTVHAIEYTGERAGRLQGFWFEPKPGAGDFFDPRGRATNGGWLRTPLRYDHISSRFDRRRKHPILKRIVPHHGVDYAAASGTPVWSAADGVVHYAGYKGANGNLVAIRHDGGYETFYAHLSRIARGIKRGTKVKQRQAIGAVGTTGRSTGPHLHFALKRGGRFLDPMKQLNRPGKRLPTRYMARFRKARQGLQAELGKIVLAPAPPAEGTAERVAAEVFHEEGAL